MEVTRGDSREAWGGSYKQDKQDKQDKQPHTTSPPKQPCGMSSAPEVDCLAHVLEDNLLSCFSPAFLTLLHLRVVNWCNLDTHHSWLVPNVDTLGVGTSNSDVEYLASPLW